MNAIINDSMTLDEKLKAIDEAMTKAVESVNDKKSLKVDVPFDPADLTMCIGCQ